MILSKPILIVAAFAICSSVVSATAGVCAGSADQQALIHVQNAATGAACHCIPGFGKTDAHTFGDTATECHQHCLAGQYTDPLDDKCKTPAGTRDYINNDKTGFILCPQTFDFKAATPQDPEPTCHCPQNKKLIPGINGAFTCGPATVKEDCAAEYLFVNGACSAAACVAPLVPNNARTACVCPTGKGKAAAATECLPCTAHQFANDAGECTNIEPNHIVNVAGRSQAACPATQYAIGNVCEPCPTNAVVVGGQCVCHSKGVFDRNMLVTCPIPADINGCTPNTFFEAGTAPAVNKCTPCAAPNTERKEGEAACHAPYTAPPAPGAGTTEGSAGVLGFAPQAVLFFGSLLGALFYNL